jgi:hypothetical protein
MFADLTHMYLKGRPLYATAPLFKDVLTLPAGLPADKVGPIYGGFSGAALIEDEQGRKFEIDGALVSTIVVDPKAGNCQLMLVLPSPVPGYAPGGGAASAPGVDKLEFMLWAAAATGGGTWCWSIAATYLPWLRYAPGAPKGAAYTARLDQWLLNGDGTGIPNQLQLAVHPGNTGFPLDQLGLCTTAGQWINGGGPFDHTTQCGLLLQRPAVAGSAWTASLVMSVSSHYEHVALGAFPGLRLAGLDKASMGDNNASGWDASPLVLQLPLQAAESPPLWRLLVRWSPVLAEDAAPKNVQRLRADPCLQRAWNPVVTSALQGRRALDAAHPLVPLPVLSFGAGDSAVDPLLVFDLPQTSHVTPQEIAAAQARLRRVLLAPRSAGARQSMIATWNWAAASTTDGNDAGQPPVTLTGPLREIDGSQAPIAWTADTTSAAFHGVLATGLPSTDGDSSDVVAQWTIENGTFDVPASQVTWLTWGALDIGLSPASRGTLTCRLRGTWTRGECDLYPEIDLGIDGCQVRPSQSSDVGATNTFAQLDVSTLAQDRLERDTPPLRFRLEAGVNDDGDYHVRVRCKSAPGFDAVSRVEVRSKTGPAPIGGPSLYLQIRPFTVAHLDSPMLDVEAGDLVAQWSSDDPEGTQWRFPSSSVSFMFPPQAVGEEMERGVRFWTRGTADPTTPQPWISPASPIRYRFSPPTRMAVSPSIVPRLYNRIAANLQDLLSDAKVESFRTECVYPIQVDFATGPDDRPDLRISETAAFLGHAAPSLPASPKVQPLASAQDDADRRQWLRDLYDGALADYASATTDAAAAWQGLRDDYDLLRARHMAQRATFAARLGEFHLHDALGRDAALPFGDSLSFRIRGCGTRGAAPLANPLPQWSQDDDGRVQPIGADLTPEEKAALAAGADGFLATAPASRPPDWGTPDQGAFAGGVLHTLEFASELLAILRNPASRIGGIDRISFSALGATAQGRATFDEGRTTFIVETRHGQVSRLVRERIGRFSVLWNKAKHVVVYERTTVSSEQFSREQDDPLPPPDPVTGTWSTHGWPILRKTEEYVEPIEFVRDFATEPQHDSSRTGFVQVSECVTRRIYVNAAWGRDLGHGYEIPLWDAQDRSGFYPRPQLALRVAAGGGAQSRATHVEPQNLYFYSNTEAGTGDDPDLWPAKPGVDGPNAVPFLPVVNRAPANPGADARRATMGAVVPPATIGGARRPRFDFAVTCDGKVDLMHTRGDNNLLATVTHVGMARTAASAAVDSASANFANLSAATLKHAATEALAVVAPRLQDAVADLRGRVVSLPGDARQASDALKAHITACLAGDGQAPGLLQQEMASALQHLPAIPNAASNPLTQAIDALCHGLAQFGPVLVSPLQSLRDEVRALQYLVADQTARNWVAQLTQVTAAAKLADGAVAAQAAAIARQAERLQLAPITLADAAHTQMTALQQWQTNLAAKLAALSATLQAPAPDWGAIGQGLREAIALLDQQSQLPVLSPAVSALSSALRQVLGVVALPASLKGPLGDLGRTTAALGANALLPLVDGAAHLVGGLSGPIDVLHSYVVAMTNAFVLAPNAGDTTAASRTRALIADTINALSHAASVDAKRQAVREQLAALDRCIAGTDTLALNAWNTGVVTLSAHLGATVTALGNLQDTLTAAIVTFAQAALAPIGTALLGDAQAALAKTLDVANAAFGDACDAVMNQVAALEGGIRDAITTQVGEQLAGMSASALAAFEDEVGGDLKFAAQPDVGLKLVKAFASPDPIGAMRLNTKALECVFADELPQIDTSDFAATIRDADSSLKNLGLAVPSRLLLDQVVPASLQGLGFGEVFGQMGGIDFTKLFPGFTLPELRSDQIRMSQNVDATTGTARFKADVAADFPQEQTLFEIGPAALRVSGMSVTAHSEVSTGPGGTALTTGQFVGDWALDVGGFRSATIRGVGVSYDGHRLSFDVSPERIDYHPALKFIQDYARAVSMPRLPSGVELLKDGRGVPVGVKATLVTVVPPQDFGAIIIGALPIGVGVGLCIEPDSGDMAITASASVGSKAAPVFVQISYLGGGMWLEAQCTRAAVADFSASIGVSIGSMRAINLAGIATASYSILLFVEAEVDPAQGGSIRAGISMAGNARILGLASASLNLLLEAIHSGGGMQGTGRLDVSIDICWCYTLRVHQAVRHSF